MTKFKDVAHLYFGCSLIAKHDIEDCPEGIDPIKKGDILTLALMQKGGFQINGGEDYDDWPYGVSSDNGSYFLDHSLGDFKPILRPLSSMTDEEKENVSFNKYSVLRNETNSIVKNSNSGFIWAAHQTAYLLSKYFDLFGFVESGEAIDATTLEKI